MNRFWLLCYLSLGLDITGVNNLISIFISFDELTGYRKHLLAVQHNGFALQFVPNSENNRMRTPEICLMAVRQNGHALCFVPDEEDNRMRTPEICLAAVRSDGHALCYVPDEEDNRMKTREVCLAAVRQDRLALHYVPNELVREIRRQCEAPKKLNMLNM